MTPLKVMVTGHRNLPNQEGVEGVLRLILERILVRESAPIAISGMAMGADLIFAEVALSLDIPLWAAIPLENQSEDWPFSWQKRWEKVLRRASRKISVWEEPNYQGFSQRERLLNRNLWMLDNSEVIVAVWDGRLRGGTFHTIAEAGRRGRRFLHLNPKTLILRAG